MATCPYCSDIILQRVVRHELLWFCRHCWTEIPDAVVQRQMLSDRLPSSVKSRLVALSAPLPLNPPLAA